MDIINVTEARANLYNIINAASENHEPVFIKGKKNSAVLVSESDWNAINETLYLTSIKGMKESIQEGLDTDLDECSTELDW